MNQKNIVKRLVHFYPVLGAVVFGVVLWSIRQYSGAVSIQLTLTAILGYIGLAYVYHHFDKTLTLEVIVEYILLGLLIVVILESYLL
jgi:hypothetical protein